MTRLITTGVGTIEVSEPPFSYSVVDVGGQRNERKKWMHCFDDVKAIVFFISLAGYNQVGPRLRARVLIPARPRSNARSPTGLLRWGHALDTAESYLSLAAS